MRHGRGGPAACPLPRPARVRSKTGRLEDTLHWLCHKKSGKGSENPISRRLCRMQSLITHCNNHSGVCKAELFALRQFYISSLCQDAFKSGVLPYSGVYTCSSRVRQVCTTAFFIYSKILYLVHFHSLVKENHFVYDCNGLSWKVGCTCRGLHMWSCTDPRTIRC